MTKDFNNFDESIYNVVSPELIAVDKPSMYHSIHSPKTFPSCSTFGTSQTRVSLRNINGDVSDNIIDKCYSRPHAWWGPRENEHSSASCSPLKALRDLTGHKHPEYLSFSDLKQKFPNALEVTSPKPNIRPPVPQDRGKIVRNAGIDFIKANALHVIHTNHAHSPSAPHADCKKDEDKNENTISSSLPSIHLTVDENLGIKSPKISSAKLSINSPSWKRSDCLGSDSEGGNIEESKVTLMNETDRQDLIEKLKMKWEKVNAQYQLKTPTIMKTAPSLMAIQRYEKLEHKLRDIETSIQKLNKRYVFVDMEN